MNPNGPVGPNTKPSNPKDIAAAVAGRVPVDLFPDTATIAGAMAFWEGANKYGQYNWRVAGVLASVYSKAVRRHLYAWWNGQDTDPDSGLPHLWKALACIAVLIDAESCGLLTDDRPPSAPVHEMLEDLKTRVNDIAERLTEYEPHQWTQKDLI